MAITIKNPPSHYSGETLSALAKMIDPKSRYKGLEQILTRFDFQNRSFPAFSELCNEIKRELYPDAQRWAHDLTSDDEIQRAVTGNFFTNVVMVRGTSVDSAGRVKDSKTAGGEASNFGCGRPSNQQAVSQVGGSQPGQAQVKLPEFTSKLELADKWAKRGGFLFIKISAAYLTRGDVGQLGWVALRSAPIVDTYFVPHPNPVAFDLPNAD